MGKTTKETGFQNLNIDALKTFVHGWIKHDEYGKHVIRATLYRYANPPRQYALVFEVDDLENLKRRHKVKRTGGKENVFEHTVSIETDPNEHFFEEVYRRRITKDLNWLKDEWEILTTSVDDIDFEQKYPGIRKDEHFIEVYNVNKAELEPGDEQRLYEIAEQAMPEMEYIYNAIRKVGFSGRKTDPQPEWEKAAICAFQQRSFKLVKREYLKYENLYFLNAGKESRDFRKKLLVSIARDQGILGVSERKADEVLRKIRKAGRHTDTPPTHKATR
jgi:hypothetical protein